MQNLQYTYETCVELSERVAWSIKDIIPPGQQLDFTKKFLPDSMVGGPELSLLSDEELLKLNQVRGNSYTYIFQFVEEYIIAMTMKHATAEVFGDIEALRALLRFSEEEVKHQKLFRKFNELFTERIGVEPAYIGSPVAVAEAILKHSPMAVLLVTLQLELMTQRHWVEIVSKGAPEEFDPLFRSMLKHHWLEEAQHAKIDTLELHKLAEDADKDQIEAAFKEYLSILSALEGLLAEQAAHDVATLERLIPRRLSAEERDALYASQKRSYMHVFLRLGLTAPGFMDTLGDISASGQEQVAAYLAALN